MSGNCRTSSAWTLLLLGMIMRLQRWFLASNTIRLTTSLKGTFLLRLWGWQTKSSLNHCPPESLDASSLFRCFVAWASKRETAGNMNIDCGIIGKIVGRLCNSPSHHFLFFQLRAKQAFYRKFTRNLSYQVTIPDSFNVIVGENCTPL